MDMDAIRRDAAKVIEPAAPVTGGMRWRTPYHEYLDRCRRYGCPVPRDGDAPVDRQPYAPEPGASGGPAIVTAPPPEARVEEEYVYHARAYDGVCDGFTWYFAECPPGMRVDRHTGAVIWTPAEGGRFRVTLCARSLYGAESRQSWTLCVRKAARVRAAVPNTRFSRAIQRKILHSAQPIRPPWRAPRRRPGVVPRATAPPGPPSRAAPPLPALRI